MSREAVMCSPASGTLVADDPEGNLDSNLPGEALREVEDRVVGSPRGLRTDGEAKADKVGNQVMVRSALPGVKVRADCALLTGGSEADDLAVWYEVVRADSPVGVMCC